MTPRRAATIFAILTALIAAPSAVLGAPPNALLGAAATPTAGTTDTRFMLSVGYLSSTGTPAGSVTATVAGRTLSLSLVAGSSTSGTWSVSSTLPAGTWATTFRAFPAKGPQPVLAGPTITVIAVSATAPTTPTATPSLGGASAPSNQVDGGGTAPTGTSPSAAPAALPASATAAGSASPAAVPATPAQVGPSTAPAAPGSAGTPGAPNPTAPGPGATDAPAAPAASGTSRAAASAGAIPFLPATPLGAGSETVWAIMIGGLVAVGAVALGGGAWLFIGRRRQPASEGGNVGPLPPSEPLAETTDELLSRRSRSRARIRPSDDPVLAAMNLDGPSRRSRASQVDRGSTMRDATRRRGTPS